MDQPYTFNLITQVSGAVFMTVLAASIIALVVAGAYWVINLAVVNGKRVQRREEIESLNHYATTYAMKDVVKQVEQGKLSVPDEVIPKLESGRAKLRGY